MAMLKLALMVINGLLMAEPLITLALKFRLIFSSLVKVTIYHGSTALHCGFAPSIVARRLKKRV
jgi:hypothetical protein